MTAIGKFRVKRARADVVVSADGTRVHITGPRVWQMKIGKIPVVVA